MRTRRACWWMPQTPTEWLAEHIRRYYPSSVRPRKKRSQAYREKYRRAREEKAAAEAALAVKDQLLLPLDNG